MKENEKMLQELEKYLKDVKEEDIQAKINEFMKLYNTESDPQHFHIGKMSDEEKAEEMMYDIYDLTNESQQKAELKKILKLDPNNIDALLFKMELEELNPEIELPLILSIGKKKLQKAGYDKKKYIGSYWGIIETRSYMRAKYQYFQYLRAMGKYSLALQEGLEILTLNESDNLGARYGLMGIYASLERYEEAIALHERFYEPSAMMLLPLILLCLKLNKTKEAQGYYQELQEVNPDCAQVFTEEGINAEEMENYIKKEIYSPNSAGELYIAVYDNIDLFMLNPEESFNFFYGNLLYQKTTPAKSRMS